MANTERLNIEGPDLQRTVEDIGGGGLQRTLGPPVEFVVILTPVDGQTVEDDAVWSVHGGSRTTQVRINAGEWKDGARGGIAELCAEYGVLPGEQFSFQTRLKDAPTVSAAATLTRAEAPE